MTDMNLHRATSKDGTEIAARVDGAGPPLVFLPAGPGTSEASWAPVVSHLKDRFTCYMMDTRGRGLSANNADHSPERLVEDVVAFAESLGGRVALVEWGTALWALVAASHGGRVSAVAAYEPGVNAVMSEEDAADFLPAMGRMGELAAEGRLDDAAQAFIEKCHIIYVDEDMTSGTKFWETAAPNIPVFMQEQAALAEFGSPEVDPTKLGKIDVPVLLLNGERSKGWFGDSVAYVAKHLPAAEVRKIPGAGHFGPHTQPEAVAAELVRFFSAVPSKA